MMNFLGSFLNALKPRYDDDVIDRLNYYYTCLIILVLSITISAKQYVGQPIQCWVPAQFTGAWEQYAENYCFVQNTYWLPLFDYIPQEIKLREDREIGYYQWVPFILAIEALLFYIPCMMWRLMNWQSGMNVQNIVQQASDTQNINIENRRKAVKIIATHIEDAIDLQRDFGYSSRSFSIITNCGKGKGIYVTMLYIVVKLCYVCNVIGQFFLLNAFLGTRYTLWGLEVLRDLAKGDAWDETGHFPRVTMCDFEVRVMGNVHRYTIQCVLMINMFNEKIFLFLWWWFLIVAITTIVGLIYWVATALPFNRREEFIRKYLRISEALAVSHSTRADKRVVQKFVKLGLRPDGVFMMRIIAYNAGDIIATEIIEELWKSFKEKYYIKYNGTFKPHGHEEALSPLLASEDKQAAGFVETLFNATPSSNK